MEGVEMMKTVVLPAVSMPEYLWRWSWLRLQWTVSPDDEFVFTTGDPGVCMWGMEDWRPL